MTARVINDPSALGWEYDPDTGRWTWGGHSSSGGGGGGSFPEAPVDGEQYARQNAGWAIVEHPEGGTGGGGDYVESGTLKDDSSVAAHPTAYADNMGVAIGLNAAAGAGDQGCVAIGTDSEAGEFSGSEYAIAIGHRVRATHSHSIALGSYAQTTDRNQFMIGSALVPLNVKIHGNGTMQAADFLDADGKSIIGGGGGGTVTTADVQLTNPTTFMPDGMATQEDANAYIEGELQKIIPDANADGTIYGRQNNAWVAVPAGGGDGNVDLTAYYTKTESDARYQAKGSYLTSSDLNGYATQTWVSSNYQAKGNYLTSESDPTVPSWVKSITQNDINNWNSSSGGGDPFPWTGSQAEFVSNRNGENIKITAGGSRGPEILFANTGGGVNNKSIRAAGGKLEFVNGAYSAVIFSCADDGIVTATDFIATSDRNKKDHIETAPTGVIEKLRGVTFQWKDTGRESAGVIAQELQDAGLGHLVHEDEDGLSVAYAGLTAYLIEEIKLLKAEIEALK